MIKLTITTKGGTTVSLDIPDADIDLTQVLRPVEEAQPWISGSPEPQPEEQKLAEEIVEQIVEQQTEEPKQEPSIFDLDHTVDTALDQFQFPCKDGSVYTPAMELTRDFVMAFGEEHVTKEFLKARSWLIANPEKRKTLRGMGRYLNTWLCHQAGMKRTSVKEAIKTKTGSLLDEGTTDHQGW